MAYIRKIIKVGDSLAVGIPRVYLNYYKIARHYLAAIHIGMDGDLTIKFFNPDKRPDALKDPTLVFDEDEQSSPEE